MKKDIENEHMYKHKTLMVEYLFSKKNCIIKKKKENSKGIYLKRKKALPGALRKIVWP
jgi:hypothetical protein